MEENNQDTNQNKVPSKMSRLAWPKAKYGVVLAIIIIAIITPYFALGQASLAILLGVLLTFFSKFWFSIKKRAHKIDVRPL